MQVSLVVQVLGKMVRTPMGRVPLPVQLRLPASALAEP